MVLYQTIFLLVTLFHLSHTKCASANTEMCGFCKAIIIQLKINLKNTGKN